MAIGTPATLKDNGVVTTSGQTTVAVTSVVVPANTHVEVVVACSNAGTAVGDPTGISDGTNSYTKDDSATRLSNVYESVWHFYYTTGGTKTITVTLAAACNYTHVVVLGTSNAATAGTADVIGGGDQGGTTTVTVVSVGNVAQNDEAAILGLNWGTSTALATWPSTGYTSLVNNPNATRGRGHAVAYRTPLTSAGGTETAANQVLLGGATSWAGVLATYKGASSGTAWSQNLADTITLSDTSVKSLTLSKSDTITLSDALAKAVVHPRADTVSLSDSIVKSPQMNKSDTLTLTDAVAKMLGLNKSDSITLTDAVAKSLAHQLADTITLSDVLTPTFSPGGATAWTLNLADTITLADALHRTLTDMGATPAGAAAARTIILNRYGTY